MSVERHQTILQFATQGAEQVLAEINRVVRAMRDVSGPTSFQALAPGTQQAIGGQRPETFNRLTGLQAQQELAQRKLVDAIDREVKLREAPLRKGETAESRAQKLRVAENATIAATVRDNKARESLASEVYKLLPAVQERVAQERLGAAMARDYVSEQRARGQARDQLERERDRARDSLERQRNRALARQVAEEDKAARDRERRSSVALTPGEVSALTASPTRQPGDTDRVYRARQRVAEAEAAYAAATARHTEATQRALTGDGRSREQLQQALVSAANTHTRSARAVEDAQGHLQSAIRAQTLVHAQNTRRSVREDFISGFRGQGDAPYGQQIGQAFKFSVFYGTAYHLLFGLTQTLQATVQEGIAFQQGMTNLALATERPKEELDEIANRLSSAAVRAGAAPSQGIEIGARSLGLYGVTDSSAAIQNRVMETSARVVSQLAVGSTKTPVELQGDIAAVAQALGLGASGQFRIADLDAYFTKKFGIEQGSTLETVAQSASVGKAAGFSDEQLFAIAADMISRTGQTPSAVSGYMAQIFSRGGEGSLVDVARRQGIDPTQELAGILGELAQVYKTAGPQEQAEISAAFGRGKVQNAAVALLSDYDEVLKRSGEALTDASGQADKQYAMRMSDIGGQVDRLMGVMKEFASLFGESGFLDIVGLGIITFREFLEAVNGFLKVWNQLPDAIQDTIIGLGLLTVALRSGAGAAIAGALSRRGAGQFGRVYGPTLPGGGVAMAGGTYAPGTRVLATGGGVVPVASRAGASALARAGGAALGMIGPVGIAIGGLLAIGALKNSSEEMRAAQTRASAALAAPSAGPGSTSSEFQAYASELRNIATQNREATGLLMKIVTFGQGDDTNIATAQQLEGEAKRLEGIARRLAASESRSGPLDSSVFSSTAAEDLASGLDALQAGGATASDQLAALRDVLFGTADAAEAAKEAFDPRDFAAEAASGIVGAMAESLKGEALRNKDAGIKGGSWAEAMAAGLRPPEAPDQFDSRIAARVPELRGRLTELLSGTEAQKRLQGGLRSLGVTSEADIDTETADQLAAIVGEGMAKQLLAPYGAKGGVIKAYQDRINASVSKFLVEQARDTRDLVTGTGTLTPEDATAAALHILDQSEAAMGSLAEVDTGGQVEALRSRIRDLRGIARRTDEPIGIITEQIALARRAIANAQFQELERLRRLAQRNADSKREIANIGKGFLEREIRAAVRGRDADLLVQILEQAGKGAITIATDVINDAIAVVNAARQVAHDMTIFGSRVGGVVRGQAAAFRERAQQTGNAEVAKQAKELEKMAAAVEVALPARGDDDVYTSGSDSGSPLLDKETGAEKDSPAQIAAARAAAFATRSEGQIRAARAAVQQARANIADAKRGTVEYWNAMGSLFDAQNQLTDAVLAFRSNRDRLRIDITNPLAEARLAVRDAARRLRSDRGQAADVRAQDRVDLREARANREATAFSQRLQAVQTAEELGRISHTKYINYLENEKRRLERVKNRTFQQQEQLDQVDKLLQSAAKEMQGQFNLGDIKLPTPYQVRRYIEQNTPASSERLATTVEQNTTLTMHVDGADTAKVTAIVKDVVGKGARVRTTGTRRR